MRRPLHRARMRLNAVGVAAAVAFAPLDAPAEPAAETGSETAAVLLLDGDDPAVAGQMTGTLQTELEGRGVTTQRGSTGGELVIALDCDGLDATCLGRAAKQMDVDRIFFGTATLKAERPTLSVRMYSVGTSEVTKEVVIPIEGSSEAARAASIETAVRSLLPETDPDDELPPATAAAAPGPVASTTAATDRGKPKLIWGAYSPRPKWKWGLLAASVGVATVGLGLGLVFGVPAYRSTQRRGRLYVDLVASAEASLVDDEKEIAAGSEPGFNDVDPAIVQEICSDKAGSGGALEVVGAAGDGKPAVRNASVAEQCRKGEVYATVGNVGFAIFAVGLAGTVASTILLFVHRRDPTTAWRRREVSLSLLPTRGGAVAGGSFRF